MYHLTGLPGWVRFGYSPGWMGKSSLGLGPCAQYLMYGSWPTPQMNYLWRESELPFSPAPGFPMPGFPTPYDPWGAAEITPERELEFLRAEARRIESELQTILNRIKEIETEEVKK